MLNAILQKDRYVYILLCIVVITIYLNSLGNDFVSDDREGILFNPEVGEWSYVFRSFIGMGNSITRLFIAHIFGMQAWAFRGFNILMHAGAVCSVYYLFKNLYDKRLGLLTSFLFAVHPILTESITWIAGAGYVSYGLYFLLSFIFFLESDDKYNWKYFLSIFLYLCAILTSEKAVSLSAIFILYKFIYSQESRSGFWKSTSYMLISIPFIYLLTQVLGKRTEILAKTYYQEGGYVNPLQQIPIAITEYIQLFLWPQGLTLYHSEVFYTYTEYYIRAAVFLAIIIPIFILLFKVRRGFKNTLMFWKNIAFEKDKNYLRILSYKYLAFWFFFFVIVLLPTLTPLKISWLVAERYVYLGIVGLSAIVAYVFYKLINIESVRISIIGIFIFMLIVLGIRTVYRNTDWFNEDTLWFATVKYSPSSPNIHNNLGDVYSRRGEYDKALQEFSYATKLKPNYADAYHNLAYTYQTLYTKEQDPVKKKEYIDLAKQNYLEAIKHSSVLWQSRQNLAILHFEEGDLDKGYERYREALTISPNNFNLIATYININIQVKNYEEAEKAAVYLLEMDPTNADVQNVLNQIKELRSEN